MNNIEGILPAFPSRSIRNSEPLFVLNIEKTQCGDVAIFQINDPRVTYNKDYKGEFLDKVSAYLSIGVPVKIDCGVFEDKTEIDFYDFAVGKINPKMIKDKTMFIATQLLPDGISKTFPEDPTPTTGSFAEEILKTDGVEFESDVFIDEVSDSEKPLEPHLFIMLTRIVKPVRNDSEIEEDTEPVSYETREDADSVSLEGEVFRNEGNENKEVIILQENEVTKEEINHIVTMINPDRVVGKAVELAIREPSELIEKVGIEIVHGDGESEVDIFFVTPEATSYSNIYVPIITTLANMNKNVLIKSDYKDQVELFITRSKEEVVITIDDFSASENKSKLLPLITEFILQGYKVVLDINEERPASTSDYELCSLVDQVGSETGIEVELKEEEIPDLEYDKCFVLVPLKNRKRVA